MYCSQCGATFADEAKFCSNCGSSLTILAPKKTNELPPAPPTVRNPKIIWVVVVGLAAFFVYAGIFLVAFAGKSPNPQAGWGGVFWTGLFFYLWWKHDNRKPWQGALLGVVLAFLLFGIAAFVSGYVGRANEKRQQAVQASSSNAAGTSDPWIQSQLNETYMRTLTKDECMKKTISTLKGGCNSETCLKTVAGVAGDCVTWASGEMKSFCSSYDKYTTAYCLSNDLDAARCKVINAVKTVFCAPAP